MPHVEKLSEFKSKLDGIVAKKLGEIQAFVAKAENTITGPLNELATSCPDTKQINKYNRLNERLKRQINRIEKRLVKLEGIPERNKKPINFANKVLDILGHIPIPTSVPPGIGIPLFIPNTQSLVMNWTNGMKSTLETQNDIIDSIVSQTRSLLQSLQDNLALLDEKIAACLADPNADLTALDPIPKSDGRIIEAYKDYTIEVLVDEQGPDIALRRYAVAFDRQGIQRLKGELSFASDPKILIDEIKFKIDNQLP